MVTLLSVEWSYSKFNKIWTNKIPSLRYCRRFQTRHQSKSVRSDYIGEACLAIPVAYRMPCGNRLRLRSLLVVRWRIGTGVIGC